MKDEKAKYLIIDSTEINKQLYKVTREAAYNDFYNVYEPNGMMDASKIFEKNGWKLVFDTSKTDYQYSIGDMKSRIQLQDIEGIGLMIYYDNPDYYHMKEDEQRVALIRELNSYGFDLNENVLGVDKLKTFVHKKLMFSKNQNG